MEKSNEYMEIDFVRIYIKHLDGRISEILYDKQLIDVVSKYYLAINGSGYAICTEKKSPKKVYKLHRLILGVKDRNIIIDHINGNKLDNRTCNLRIVTHRQNSHNVSSHKDSLSKYVGVSFDKKKKKWRASIRPLGKHITIGRFKNEIDAAIARDLYSIVYYGEYAKLNLKEYNYEFF